MVQLLVRAATETGCGVTALEPQWTERFPPRPVTVARFGLVVASGGDFKDGLAEQSEGASALLHLTSGDDDRLWPQVALDELEGFLNVGDAVTF
jgi:hypothetical protein